VSTGLVQRVRAVLGKRSTPVPGLAERVASFREVLHANNTALGHLAAIQAALGGERAAGPAEVRRLVAGVTVQAFRMVVHLNRLTGGRYAGLRDRFGHIRARVGACIETARHVGDVPPVLEMDRLDATLADAVGQKSAMLGAVRAAIGGAVPDGFTTTVAAYRLFMAANGLAERVAAALAEVDPGDVPSAFAAAASITASIEAAPVPAEVSEAIERAVARLAAAGATRFAVRSSALQEGGLTVSFAGQYRSLLNVPPDEVVDAFRRVVASKYSAQAIAYRQERGFDDAEVAMCCCVLPMVDAVGAGVLYSACAVDGGTATLIQAVRGLGLAAVDGSVRPESIVVDRLAARVSGRRPGRQPLQFRCAPGAGTERCPCPDSGTVLDDRRAEALARLSWSVEAVAGTAVDLEWAIDGAGGLWVLQVRPQPVHADGGGTPTREPVRGASLRLRGGARASGGVAAGAVYRITRALDLLSCPVGAVAVVAEAAPRLAVVLPRLAAVVADMGDVTGHLATVARELGVPAIFGVESATRTLADGEEITVDADACAVYRGAVSEALERAAGDTAPRRRPEHLERLARAAELIVPLNLTGRMAGVRSIRRCRTVHDVIRLCHQATVEALFDLGDRRLRAGGLRRLVSDVPIDCRVIDLGGGLRPEVGPGDVTLGEVTCLPLRALWRGMTDPRLRWRMTRPVSMRGFVSALVNYNFDEDGGVRAMGEPSYAIVTDRYLNLNSRIGYHFATVDAHVGEVRESNYASFRFVGGSTGVDQRSRRATLIEHVLAARGFETDRCADLVNARVRHLGAAEMEEKLAVVGMVNGYVNHLDMALTTDALVERYAQAFLAGNLGFGRDDGHGT